MAQASHISSLSSFIALLILCQASGCAVARLVDDGSLGITRYDFRGVWSGVPGILSVYLRPACIGRTLFVRGVLGVITAGLQADSSDRYTAPASLVDHNWSLRLVDRSSNSSTAVRVYKTVDRGERTLTFSQLEAQLAVPNQLDLFVDGSPWRHELYLPDCVLSEDAEDHPLQQLPGGLFNDRHWLVTLLPRVLPVATQQYAELLLAHMRYHQHLGFAGTLLLCDLHQAHELTQLQAVQEALDQDSILMWPWQHEHPAESHPLYWQVPRYQLVAVAGWGHAMRAAFLDVDDFLVTPSGQAVNQEGSCLALQTSQQELLHQLHWEASLPAGAVVTVSESGGSSSSSDEDGGSSSEESSSSEDSSSSGGSSGQHKEAGAAAAAVLRVPRFDALMQSHLSECTSAAACAAQHGRWFEQPGAQLAVSTCPVEQGGVRASRRPVVSPHEVVAMRVYTAAARGDKLAGPSSPPSCAYLLHVTNLLQPAQPWGKTVAAEWQLQPGGELPGRLQLETGQLPRRQPLSECLQQDGSSRSSSSGSPGGLAAAAEAEEPNAIGEQ